jgi:hypothetical protein
MRAHDRRVAPREFVHCRSAGDCEEGSLEITSIHAEHTREFSASLVVDLRVSGTLPYDLWVHGTTMDVTGASCRV